MKASVNILLALCSSAALAQQGSLDLTVEVATPTKDAGTARRELLDLGAKKGIEDFLKSEFSDELVNKSRSAIDGRILKDFSRYVPSSRHLEFAETPEGFKSKVSLKLNRADLLRRSFEIGLRRPSELEPIILPLWSWSDDVRGVSFQWWNPETGPEKLWLQSMAQSWEAVGGSAFERQGLQFLKPQQLKFTTAVPEGQRKPQLEREDIESLAKHWRSPMVLDGSVRVLPVHGRLDVFRIDVNLAVRFMRNGREVGELVRSFETDPGQMDVVVDRKLKEIRESMVQELAEQVGEVRQRGTLQAEVAEFEFNGDLAPMQREILRRHLAEKFRGIKGVRERMLSGRKTIFEVDMIQSLAQAAKELQDMNFGTWSVKLDGQDSTRLVFRVSRKENAP